MLAALLLAILILDKIESRNGLMAMTSHNPLCVAVRRRFNACGSTAGFRRNEFNSGVARYEKQEQLP